MKRREGFTLVELLIVVVIIGILVSISIPIFTAQMHKAKVAADWANLRAYYAEIQADYMSTQKQNPKVKVIDVAGSDYDWQSVTFLDGHKVKMKAGYCAVRFKKDKGYSIAYNCNKGHAKCDLGLGEKYTSQ